MVLVFDLFHKAKYSLGPSMLQQMAVFHSFLGLSNIPLCVCACVCVCVCVCVYTHHIFLIQLSVDEHLDCFHVLAIINSAVINIGVHVSL